MSRPKRIYKKIRIGLSHQGFKMLQDLINVAGETYQGWFLNIIKKEWERLSNKNPLLIPSQPSESQEDQEDKDQEELNDLVNRLMLVVPEQEQRINGKAMTYASVADLRQWAHEKAEEYNVPLSNPEEQEHEEEEQKPISKPIAGTPVKRIKAFIWELSSHPKYKGQRLFGKITVVEPHKLAELSRSKTARILRTKEEVEQASKEVIEIGEWQAKTEEEFRKKYKDEAKFNTEWDKVVGTYNARSF